MKALIERLVTTRDAFLAALRVHNDAFGAFDATATDAAYREIVEAHRAVEAARAEYTPVLKAFQAELPEGWELANEEGRFVIREGAR